MKYKVEYYSDFSEEWQIQEVFQTMEDALEYAKGEFKKWPSMPHRVVQEVWNSNDIT